MPGLRLFTPLFILSLIFRLPPLSCYAAAACCLSPPPLILALMLDYIFFFAFAIRRCFQQQQTPKNSVATPRRRLMPFSAYLYAAFPSFFAAISLFSAISPPHFHADILRRRFCFMFAALSSSPLLMMPHVTPRTATSAILPSH